MKDLRHFGEGMLWVPFHLLLKIITFIGLMGEETKLTVENDVNDQKHNVMKMK